MSLFSGARPEARAIGDAGYPLVPSRSDARRTAGILVTTDRALTSSTVWACSRLRAEIVSTMPLDQFRKTGPSSKVAMPTSPLLVTPGGGCDITEFLYSTQMSLDLRGNAFGVIVSKDQHAYPTQIELIHPDMVRVERNKASGEVIYHIMGSGKALRADEVYHEKAHTFPGSLVGLSPVSFAATAIGVDLAAQQFGADWFQDGAHPSSVLMTDSKVDEVQAKTIKERFLNAIRGTREPAVLGLGLKYQAIQVAANESQFLDTMRFSIQQVCRFFGVPPELIGGEAGSSMTYASVEQRGIDFLTYGIGPTFTRRERALSRLLPQPQFVKFNTGALQRTDIDARYKAHAQGIAAKFLTPDEVREIEDRPPLTDEQKAILELVPLTVSATGLPKVTPTPGKPQEDLNA